jgi:hypothetical protein
MIPCPPHNYFWSGYPLKIFKNLSNFTSSPKLENYG